MSTDILIGLLQLIPAMLVSSFLVFILLHLALGDPAETIAGPGAPRDVIAAVRHRMGLGWLRPVQYAIWLSKTARADLGTSYISSIPMLDPIRVQRSFVCSRVDRGGRDLGLVSDAS